MSQRRTREERKKDLEIEEQRKKGLIAPEIDEDGKAINPHIPHYMSNAPWYATEDATKPSLKHQKNWQRMNSTNNSFVDNGKDNGSGDYDNDSSKLKKEEIMVRERERQRVRTMNTNYNNNKMISKQFRKGSCENCGSMKHERKDCLERPRKVSAKKQQKTFARDDEFEFDTNYNTNNTNNKNVSYDEKRDNYKAFLAEDYEKVVERYEEVETVKAEAAKKRELERAFKKSEKKNGEYGSDDDDDLENNFDGKRREKKAKDVNDIYASDTDSDDDEEKLKASEDAGFGKLEKRIRAPGGGASGSVRNLRLREDTAKYLRNLDPQSAFYDPKTRSMRENPTPNADPNDNFFRGDNAARNSGETTNFALMNVHAWEATTKHGQDVHVQAAPSQAELMYKRFKEKKEALDETQKMSVLSKYGDASAGKLEDAPEGLVLGQTERFIVYDRFGRVISGGGDISVKTVAVSRYEEDVLLNNHTKIWGSYWNAGKWGYACCHSCVKSSYCIGIKGIEDGKAAEELMIQNMERAKERAKENRENNNSKVFTENKKDLWGGDAKDVELDPKKLGEALKREDERIRRAKEEEKEEEVQDGNKNNKKKPKYNDSNEEEVTEEQMEAYRMMRDRGDDPMMKKDSGGKASNNSNGYDLV